MFAKFSNLNRALGGKLQASLKTARDNHKERFTKGDQFVLLATDLLTIEVSGVVTKVVLINKIEVNKIEASGLAAYATGVLNGRILKFPWRKYQISNYVNSLGIVSFNLKKYNGRL